MLPNNSCEKTYDDIEFALRGPGVSGMNSWKVFGTVLLNTITPDADRKGVRKRNITGRHGMLTRYHVGRSADLCDGTTAG